MRLESYLCLGGNEISNGARVASYVNNVGVPEATMPVDCQCAILNDGYDTPITDPAPWYDSAYPASADFLGLWIYRPTLTSPFSRSVAQAGRRGSVLSPVRLKGRILQVTGLMMATTSEGMYYGERWLEDVLQGTPCDEGGCGGDDALVLTACPEEAGYDPDHFYRVLVGSGLIDTIVWAPVQQLPECSVQEVSFQISSSMPHLYLPATRHYDRAQITGTLSAALETPEWVRTGTYRIEVENVGTTDATNIVITGQISLDGSCPVSGAGTSVPPTFIYTIPTLRPDDRYVIDGARRQTRHYDASQKFSTPDLSMVDFEGPWIWPDVGPCTTMCLTITASTGTVAATVDSYLRE